MKPELKHDLIFAGGGLASGLIAYRLRMARPELRLLVLEEGLTLGGNHTWSFHSSNLSASDLSWVRPLIAKSWPRHEVRFPNFSRVIGSEYHSVTSSRFHEVIAPCLGNDFVGGAEVVALTAQEARLKDGRVFRARCVLDGRGFRKTPASAAGYQKFVGHDVTLAKPHGLVHPLLMDATCEQRDGFRFFYVLPWSVDSLLIEDTRYSSNATLDEGAFAAGISEYAGRMGWQIRRIDRREAGCLPIPLQDERALDESGAPSAIGARSLQFHYTTGYSFPWAVRLASALAELEAFGDRSVARCIANSGKRIRAQNSFFKLLNRMLFQAADPERRYRVLERFYTLSDGLIQRFYSGRLTFRDRARILLGRPPVPVLRAARCLFEPTREVFFGCAEMRKP